MRMDNNHESTLRRLFGESRDFLRPEDGPVYDFYISYTSYLNRAGPLMHHSNMLEDELDGFQPKLFHQMTDYLNEESSDPAIVLFRALLRPSHDRTTELLSHIDPTRVTVSDRVNSFPLDIYTQVTNAHMFVVGPPDIAIWRDDNTTYLGYKNLPSGGNCIPLLWDLFEEVPDFVIENLSNAEIVFSYVDEYSKRLTDADKFEMNTFATQAKEAYFNSLVVGHKTKTGRDPTANEKAMWDAIADNVYDFLETTHKYKLAIWKVLNCARNILMNEGRYHIVLGHFKDLFTNREADVIILRYFIYFAASLSPKVRKMYRLILALQESLQHTDYNYIPHTLDQTYPLASRGSLNAQQTFAVNIAYDLLAKENANVVTMLKGFFGSYTGRMANEYGMSFQTLLCMTEDFLPLTNVLFPSNLQDLRSPFTATSDTIPAVDWYVRFYSDPADLIVKVRGQNKFIDTPEHFMTYLMIPFDVASPFFDKERTIAGIQRWISRWCYLARRIEPMDMTSVDFRRYEFGFPSTLVLFRNNGQIPGLLNSVTELRKRLSLAMELYTALDNSRDKIPVGVSSSVNRNAIPTWLDQKKFPTGVWENIMPDYSYFLGPYMAPMRIWVTQTLHLLDSPPTTVYRPTDQEYTEIIKLSTLLQVDPTKLNNSERPKLICPESDKWPMGTQPPTRPGTGGGSGRTLVVSW